MLMLQVLGLRPMEWGFIVMVIALLLGLRMLIREWRAGK